MIHGYMQNAVDSAEGSIETFIACDLFSLQAGHGFDFKKPVCYLLFFGRKQGIVLYIIVSKHVISTHFVFIYLEVSNELT